MHIFHVRLFSLIPRIATVFTFAGEDGGEAANGAASISVSKLGQMQVDQSVFVLQTEDADSINIMGQAHVFAQLLPKWISPSL